MTEQKSTWVKIKPAEVEKIILDLHKEGNSPAKIGLILRDKHGIPKAKLLDRKITKVILDAKEVPRTEIVMTKERISALERHAKIHKHDYTAKRSLGKKQWVIHRFSKTLQLS